MTDAPQSREGTPLLADQTVFRAVKRRRDGDEQPPFRFALELDETFQLSDSDKKAIPPAISVYAQDRTTPRQVLALLAAGDKYSHVAALSVAAIRAISLVSLPPDNAFTWLDCVWIMARLADGSPDERPGADGHAGIIGLVAAGLPKADRKQLRFLLAEIAATNCRTVDEWEKETSLCT